MSALPESGRQKNSATPGQGVGLDARCLSSGEGAPLTACFRLRYRSFVEDRCWVKPEGLPYPTLETDPYDPHALHLAVFEDGEVRAYLRVLPYQVEVGFMLTRDFCELIADADVGPLTAEDVEISRLALLPTISGAGTSQSLEALLRLLYQAAKHRGFRRFFIVVEESWLRPFERRFGLPFRVIGLPHTFPDGTCTVAAVATLDELEAGMRRHSPQKYAWYQGGSD